jgi:pimeloyl-ACP methyl ester carboxylesterase
VRHRDGPRPTIVAIHGFTAEGYLINEWFFALPWFYRMGCDIALFTLPFHGPRQTRFSPFSGHGFFAGGSSRFNEAVAQSVFDFRILLDWLQRQQGVEQVGVTGLSLGGFISAMLASVEGKLAFALPNVPIITVADLVLEWQPIGALMRTALAASGLSPADARRLVAVSCPLTYPPVLPPERLMIVGGAGDRLAPPKHSRILWDHWNRCRIHWFPGSHSIHLDRGEYLTQMARFMVGLGFLTPGNAR